MTGTTKTLQQIKIIIIVNQNYVQYNAIYFNSLNAKLNPVCHLLALLGAHDILHVSRVHLYQALHII